VADNSHISDRWVHDMKNCLGIVMGFADLLLDEMPPDDVRREDIQEIATAARRAVQLMTQVGGSGTERS
jgi:signal transduction histidine kinase